MSPDPGYDLIVSDSQESFFRRLSFSYAQQNADSRRRLESLVSGLSDADLARSTDYGWTVAALLAHLAFWDHRMSVILHRWQEQGFDESLVDSMAVNDALKVICHALEPRTAAGLAVSAAQKVDVEFETLSDEFVKEIEQHIEATSTQFTALPILKYDCRNFSRQAEF